MALSVMAGLWPMRLRSLRADFCAGERVIERKVKPKQSPTKKPISARYRLFSNLSQAAEDPRKTKK
ncbi:hypothetical protein HMPREF0541_02161 [Lacticaseibacillus rhamnosus ATCC 21052]|nr:hypothetical protein HMPREF0541_02161 [Lacticaseibacillus rhamnosus ATCC 21052]